jgi:ABC-type multidrug transport system ATPase subunit
MTLVLCCVHVVDRTDHMLCCAVCSGLDSTTAFHIVEHLRTLAHRGRTVLVTIHQPASEMFPLFDRFLFLAKGMVCMHACMSCTQRHEQGRG